MDTRASENFLGMLPQSPRLSLGQIGTPLAISGIFERFSPGQNGSKVGPPWGLFLEFPKIHPFLAISQLSWPPSLIFHKIGSIRNLSSYKWWNFHAGSMYQIRDMGFGRPKTESAGGNFLSLFSKSWVLVTFSNSFMGLRKGDFPCLVSGKMPEVQSNTTYTKSQTS